MTPAAAAIALAWAAAAAAAPPPAPGPDTLHVALQADYLPPGGGGGLGGTWVHPFAGRTLLHAGAYFYSLAGSRWGYGQAGVMFGVADRTTGLLEMNVGRGRREGRGFPYGIFRANVTHDLAPGRLTLELEDQYISVDEARGHVARMGAAVSRRAFAARAALHVSIGGNIGARYVSARVDVSRKTAGLLAGMNVGRTRPDVFNLLSISGSVHSTEVFVGARFPVSSREVTFVIDHLWIPGTDRTTAFLALRVPF